MTSTQQQPLYSAYRPPRELEEAIKEISPRRGESHVTGLYVGPVPQSGVPEEWVRQTNALQASKSVDFTIEDVVVGDHAPVVFLKLKFASPHEEEKFYDMYHKDYDLFKALYGDIQMTNATRDKHNGIHVTVKIITFKRDFSTEEENAAAKEAAMEEARIAAAELKPKFQSLIGTCFTGTYVLIQGRETIYQ